MIVARAPLRIPLGGGGTDLQFYSSRFGGFVLSVAIDNYAYVTTLQPSIEKGIRVKARINEYAENLNDIKNELVRASCHASGVTERLQITFSSDLSDGTGMGTSGAYTVCLMQTLSYLKGKLMDKKDLAEAAAHVELDILRRPIGKHDHYMASYGGLKLLRINKDGSVIVEDPPVTKKTLHELKSYLLLFYTGERRESSAVLSAQRELAEKNDGVRVYEYYHRIKDIGMRIHESLIHSDLIHFGELLHEHWETKRCLATMEHWEVSSLVREVEVSSCFLFLLQKKREFVLQCIKGALKKLASLMIGRVQLFQMDFIARDAPHEKKKGNLF